MQVTLTFDSRDRAQLEEVISVARRLLAVDDPVSTSPRSDIASAWVSLSDRIRDFVTLVYTKAGTGWMTWEVVGDRIGIPYSSFRASIGGLSKSEKYRKITLFERRRPNGHGPLEVRLHPDLVDMLVRVARG